MKHQKNCYFVSFPWFYLKNFIPISMDRVQLSQGYYAEMAFFNH